MDLLCFPLLISECIPKEKWSAPEFQKRLRIPTTHTLRGIVCCDLIITSLWSNDEAQQSEGSSVVMKWLWIHVVGHARGLVLLEVNCWTQDLYLYCMIPCMSVAHIGCRYSCAQNPAIQSPCPPWTHWIVFWPFLVNCVHWGGAY